VRRLFVNNSIVVRLVGLLAVMSLGMVSIVGSGGGQDITGGGVTLSGIDITPSVVSKDLLPGHEQQFIAIGTYSNNSQQILTTGLTWDSSNTSAATVNTSSGLATGIAAGTTNITASMSNVTSDAVVLTVVNPNLLSIQVSPPILPNGLPVGARQQFVAKGIFDNNQAYDITDSVVWSSDNTSVASAFSGGFVTGQAAGSANITAQSSLRTSNSVSVTVSVQTPVGLIVEPQEALPLPINRTQQFKALLLYQNDTTFDVTNDVTWSSNNPTAATVNNDSSAGAKGLATGVSTGRVTITATHSSSGNSGDAVFDVNAATIQSVSISPSTPASIPAEHTQDFTASGLFSDGIIRPLTNANWLINDNSVATFNYIGTTAQVLGVTAGTANLIYLDTRADGFLSGFSETEVLTVTNVELDSITLNPSSVTMPDEAQVSITANGMFSDASTRDITQDVWWETGDNTLVTFGAEPGELAALPGVSGSTVAQVKIINSQDVLKTSPTAAVTVQAANLTGLTIFPPASPVRVGETEQYTVEATFSNGLTADYTERVTWSVLFSNPIIATVSTASSTKGEVTGVREGPATLSIVDPQTGTPQTLAIMIDH
jgi:uncharacterized protein YjdB